MGREKDASMDKWANEDMGNGVDEQRDRAAGAKRIHEHEGRWVDGQMDRWKHEEMEAWINGQIDTWVDGDMSRSVDGKMSRWADGQMGRWKGESRD